MLPFCEMALLKCKVIIMKIYLNAREVIIDLHQRGYTEDFELNGNTLLWVQDGSVINSDEFSILECHRFLSVHGDELVIFGVISLHTMSKGILITHYDDTTIKSPAIIEEKMEELCSFAACDHASAAERWSFS
jgi:hypothetical protein